MTCRCWATVCWLLLSALPGLAQAPPAFLGDPEPVLRVEAGGMTSNVTALAFGPSDQGTLYAAGWDKVVRAWVPDAAGRLALAPAVGVRLPLGPGAAGSLNALALSADGRWLAAGGSAVMGGMASFHQPGDVKGVDQLTPEQWADAGTIYLVDTRDRKVNRLRGHKGSVVALAFAPAQPDSPRDKPPLLISVAEEWDAGAQVFRGQLLVWDPTQDKPVPLGSFPNRPQLIRPGLAVTRLGLRPQDLRIALAWGDGQLRTWEGVAAGKPPVLVQDSGFNFGLAALPKTGQLLTCSYQNKDQTGQLQLWNVVPGQAPQRDPKRVVRFAPTGNKIRTIHIPLDVVLVSSQPGAPSNYAAVVVFRYDQVDGKPQNGNIGLRLIELGERFGIEKSPVLLWPDAGIQPVATATPDGATLAVAGSGTHAVRVYSVADLLRNQLTPRHEFTSAGTAMRSVAFAQRGAHLGLALNEAPKGPPGHVLKKPRPGDQFFHFGKGTLEGDSGGWEVVYPAAEGWEVQVYKPPSTGPDAGKPWRITVRRGNKPGRALDLPKEFENVYDYALLPQPRGYPAPLLAVSFRALGQPYLWLFNAATGERLRQFTGHDGFIRAVAFAPDGRLLASAAEDKTVCVWSLAGLDTAAAGRPVMDGRRPLATLFMAREKPTDAWDWLGWIPTGRYDSSGPRGERYLGWHRNPEKAPELPTFVPVRQSRQEYHSPGVLQFLVAEGTTELGLKAWEEDQRRKQPPPPRVTVRVGDVVLSPGRDRALLRQPARTLVLTVHEFPADQIESATWYVESQGPPVVVREGQLKQSADQEWSAGLNQVKWQRGHYQIRLVLRTRERFPRTFTEEVRLHFLLPAPRIVTASPPLPALTGLLRAPAVLLTDTNLAGRWVVDRPEFTLQALAVPAPGRSVQVQVFQDKRPPLKLPQPFVNKTLDLREGPNLIRIIAVHEDALPNPEPAEKAELAVEVFYRPQVPPPQVLFDTLIVLPSGNGQPQEIPREVGKLAQVVIPQVRVAGRILSQKEPTGWGLEATGPAKLSSPLKMVPQAKGEWSFAGELSLEPGRWQLRPWVKTDKHQADAVIPVFYQPELPKLVFLPPKGGLDFLDDKGEESWTVSLTWKLMPPRDPKPYPYEALRAVVRLNGEELKEKPTLDLKTETLTVRLKLRPRENRVRVLLYGWEAVEESREEVLRYLRPPQVESFEAKPPGGKSSTDFVARVLSPAKLPLRKEFVRATIGNRQVPPDNIGVNAGEVKGKLQEWEVRLRNVALDVGVNEARLWVWNEEAEAQGSPRAAPPIVYKPKKEPPQVFLLGPAEFNVRGPEPTLKFHVISKSPLTSLVLVRQDEPAFRQELHPGDELELKLILKLSAKGLLQGEAPALEVAKLATDQEGFRHVQTACRLKRATNQLRLEAVNEGGAQSAPVVINILPPAARLVLEGLATRPGGVLVNPPKPPAEPGSTLRFPPVDGEGRVWLRGRVLWDETPDEQVRHALVYVNGLRQAKRALLETTADPRMRRFEAEVYLGQKADNHVEVELPGVQLGEENRPDFVVDCPNSPGLVPRWHVLLIAPGEREAAALERRVLRLLNATEMGPRKFRRGRQEGQLYEPLIDTAEAEYVYQRLNEVQIAIEQRAPEGPSADVILIYFQGQEQVGRGGHHFSLRPPAAAVAGEWAFRYDGLAKELVKLPGAQLLLLDVTRPTTAEPGAVDHIADADEQVRVGAFRAGWRGRIPVPDDVRLLEALRTALPRAARLEQVDTLLRERYAQAEKKHPETLPYKSYFPHSLRGLVIGGDLRP